MATTTIRIEDDLKARVAAAAERAGKTPHAFILDAIAETVTQAEQDEAFHRLAEGRWANLLESYAIGDRTKGLSLCITANMPGRRDTGRICFEYMDKFL